MRKQCLKYLFSLSCGLLALTAQAAPHLLCSLTNPPKAAPDKTNLLNHGGPVITRAKVVLIFWGPTFNNAASPDWQYARTLQAFRNQFGTSPEYRTVNQYGVISGSLVGSQPDLFDTSTPPTNVTDATVRSKVISYLSTHGGNDASTIYIVFTPRTSYSSSGASTSCGGPGLAYCAYHSWIGSGSSATKYAIIPYPSCTFCQVSGWSDVQDAEILLGRVIRETVTNPTGGGWYDSSGAEADDRCAWTPAPFFGTGGYGYQYEWSNLDGGCVKVK